MADAHSRKSRLAVPSGGVDPLLSSPPSTSKSSGGLTARLTLGGGSSRNRQQQQQPILEYLQRLLDIQQMDLQNALDQMKTLISTRPQLVYKTAYYRKQTKNHWARDDPAFVFLQAIFLGISSIAYGVAFRISILSVLSFMLASVLWNWIGLGIILAAASRETANRHLLTVQSHSHVRQTVEYLYAFDIHCNSFFPVFVVLCTYSLIFIALQLLLWICCVS